MTGEQEENTTGDERAIIAGDGKERVMGAQKDGKPPAREFARIVIIGVPVLVLSWYITQWLLFK